MIGLVVTTLVRKIVGQFVVAPTVYCDVVELALCKVVGKVVDACPVVDALAAACAIIKEILTLELVELAFAVK